MKFKEIWVVGLLLFLNAAAFSQSKDVKLPANWYNLDLVKDGYFGISTEKAYTELLKNKKPKEKIIVAVIDGGVDVNHEDLKDVLWTNKKEIPGNGIDDDGNGYIDDVHGWNFIGSKKGDLAYDNLELVRILRDYAPKYRSTIRSTVLDSTQKEEFALYTRANAEFGQKYNVAHQTFSIYSMIKKVMDSVAMINNKAVPSLEDLDRYTADSEEEEQIKKIIRGGAKDSHGIDKFYKEVKEAYKQYDVMLRYNLNIAYDQRKELVGDDYANAKERFYGNNDVSGPNAEHGSHVSGIIGANRSNNIGINGVANNVSIMAIRVVPEGDERDKDVANGIRYAVDNGARVISMSFGKGFKWNKEVVDEAVKYAEEKGVLLVHAAGNDNANNDITENYPTKYYDSPEALAHKKEMKKKAAAVIPFKPTPQMQQQGMMGRPSRSAPVKPVMDTVKFTLPHANNWIEVGASAYANDASLKADFSNYGKNTVDVFAPGFMINSTVPGSKYEEFDGTSMAAPVVSGLSALILSYYPKLKPFEVRDIIMKSVTKVTQKVKNKNERDESIRVPFTDLCVSGGIVNAYEALKLAEKYPQK
ncbi:S8 family peptidase [Pedobacter metabolipauper]|uniref:Subtilase family protein n=1 Tax=Pedobacter metabolipauper TaxID=425513 RepID=A0A4R6SV42_9SPHI|nr:S8 family peptidase [Pedobacter metabolipauper]TDQ08916.1 subtilase family protein [Pedobacter metabolipauper]